MDYERLLELKNVYLEKRNLIPKETIDSYMQAFSIEFTHNSTAIEGNTLTLIETKAVLEDGLSVGGKTLREIYEICNHNKAFAYVIYRSVDVYISGAGHTPPTPNEMYRQIKNFYADLPNRNDLNEIELAAWTHAEFVRIHPFTDGNGRTSRLIMNYQLMKNGWLPVSIDKKDRIEYYNALEKYAVSGDLSEFADMIASLEEKQLNQCISMAMNMSESINEDEIQGFEQNL